MIGHGRPPSRLARRRAWRTPQGDGLRMKPIGARAADDTASRQRKRSGMRFARRQFLRLAAGAAACEAIASSAAAQSYPARPVRFVHGFAAGGSGDIAARLIAQWLSDRLGQQFVVENRTGAGGNIGVEAVTGGLAGGYHLLQVNWGKTDNTATYGRLN